MQNHRNENRCLHRFSDIPQPGVLPGHAPVAAMLTHGTVTMTDLTGARDEVETEARFTVVHRDDVIVLIDTLRDAG